MTYQWTRTPTGYGLVKSRPGLIRFALLDALAGLLFAASITAFLILLMVVS